ncbi:MAG: hypothetical protein KF709_02700 [Gemmatimonadaceae bacterium]|nr:hypothetical protein [Gemmatimonadaceae bacterium]
MSPRRPPKPYRPVNVARAKALYAAGWSTTQIGVRLGNDHSSIVRALRRHGVVLRGRGANPRPSRIPAARAAETLREYCVEIERRNPPGGV